MSAAARPQIVEVLVRLRAVIYTRQSLGKTKSIEEQDEECTDDVAEVGYDLVAKYSDKVSASHNARKVRDQWPLLLADFQAGKFDVIVIWETSRAERRADHWLTLLEQCKKLGVLIRVSGIERTYDLRVPDDWKALATEGIENQVESAKTAHRVSRSARKLANKGKPHGKTTYGYRREYDADGKFIRQVPNETIYITETGFEYSPAGIVRELFFEVMNGTPINQLIRWLNKNKVPTANQFFAANGGKGDPERWAHTIWSGYAVKYMLTNTAYLGVRVHHRCDKNSNPHNCMQERKAAKAGCWKELVSQQVFDTVNLIVNAPERFTHTTPGVQSTPKYLLSCLAKCAECGGDMLFLAANVKYHRPNPAYRCRRTDAAVSATDLEAHVVAYVLDFLSRKATWEQLRARESDGNRRYEAARLELEAKRAELEEWRAAMESDDPAERPSIQFFARRENKLLEEIEQLDLASKDPTLPAVIQKFEGKSLSQAVSVWEALELEQRRVVVANTVDITVRRAGKGKRGVPMSQRVVLMDVLVAA